MPSLSASWEMEAVRNTPGFLQIKSLISCSVLGVGDGLMKKNIGKHEISLL